MNSTVQGGLTAQEYNDHGEGGRRPIEGAERPTPAATPKTRSRVRGAFLAFEKAMAENSVAIIGDSEDIPLRHMFSNGVYTREISVPKGTYVMGKIHRHEHPSFLIQGAIIVMTEGGVERVDAYSAMLSPPGVKRFFFTLEDTIWVTVHRTNATNVADAEKEIIAATYEDMGIEHEELTMKAGGLTCHS